MGNRSQVQGRSWQDKPVSREMVVSETQLPYAAGGPRRRVTERTGYVWTRVVLDVVCEVALQCVLSLKNSVVRG